MSDQGPHPDDARPSSTPDTRRGWRSYLAATIVVAAATGIGYLIHRVLHLSDNNVLMVYLLAVLWVAIRGGRGAAIWASFLSVALFDFCFVQPYYNLSVNDRQYIFTFLVMLVTALVISTLTDRMRRSAQTARIAWEHVETEFLRNTLLSSVSHDLRTPLSAITGAAGALVQGGPSLDAKARNELAQAIVDESERMERLINNLLDMTRLESGGLRLKKEWQPLAEVIGAALHHLRKRLGNRTVITNLPADLPMVLVDAVSLEQVVVNLVDNAVDHTPADTPLEISARREGAQTVVEIADRGPGLPKGPEDQVFQKFFHAARQPGRRGIGLGLAICRGIIKAHGGTITAANRPGGGAVFRFTLPGGLVPPPTL